MSARRQAPKKSVCAICGAPQEEPFKPFCSGRCTDVDLNRWLTGRYAVPAEELDEQDLDELDALGRGGQAGPEDGGEGGDTGG